MASLARISRTPALFFILLKSMKGLGFLVLAHQTIKPSGEHMQLTEEEELQSCRISETKGTDWRQDAETAAPDDPPAR